MLLTGGSALLAGIGLLAVAVLAGFVWWLVRYDLGTGHADVGGTAVPAEATATATTEHTSSTAPETTGSGEYVFDSATAPDVGTDCAAVSYGDVRDWLAEHPCDRVVRGLYETSADGARALVSVVVVTMPDERGAAELRALTDTTGAGNVSDMVRDGSAGIDDAPQVAGGEYASDVTGTDVTIVEAAFFDGHRNSTELADVADEALLLATELRGS
ncbi:hypothetical protein SAMN06265360_10680 [Haloechinothrix alba]|uniref:Uncharacterized protein n=1 Tax=Haloechinothrix alba TaxID=664784 RepID=A0A238WDZ7_9PSEU|nr:hypothetical protein SAMN06265360_10680 [Haloechinothrix alba]